jgi:transcriptional regulator with GAF, ATPase, and Fis domain
MTIEPGQDRDPDDLDPEELLERVTRDVDAPDRTALVNLERSYQERIRELEGGREKLLRLLDITRQLNRVGRVELLLDRILDAALEISGADRAYLLRRDEAEEDLEILAWRTREGETPRTDLLTEVSRTILDRVLEKGETLYVSDAINNPDFMSRRSVKELSLRTVVAVPLPGPSGGGGALYLDSHRAAGLLEAEGVEILEAFAAQAAIALETAAHRERLEETADHLEKDNRRLKRALGERTRFTQILGRSRAMERVIQVLERVVDNSVSVLLTGETGTGKELVAQALHFNGPRREGNFIPVNCGAIPEPLLESELFGYRKGAFTGAERDHVGLVESAHEGSLFLDEIGELGVALQVKLLRFLQESEVRRIGESRSRKVDVRIMAATNRDLAREVKEGRFREDLYYRINVVEVVLPPLRDRGEDVLLLVESFLERVRERLERPGLRLGRDARRLLLTYAWPGNVRELENAVERAGALAATDVIRPEDLLPDGSRGRREAPPPGAGAPLKETLLETERAAIRAALRDSEGNIAAAARSLGVSRQHLHNRMRRLELAPDGS